MLTEVFSTNFSQNIEKLQENGDLYFRAEGEIYSDEIVVRVSLGEEGKLQATTVHASSDFDPKASSPTVEDLLAIAVDAIGDVFAALFEAKPDSDGKSPLLASTLSAFSGIPFQWTETEVSKRKLYLKVDKSNPALEQAADDWLAKNDPEFERKLKEAEQEAEALFVLPPKKGGKSDSGLH
ncbi:hypothetical protein EBZ37_06700 [bacterium]|nr:hypothetical protein [bacterium]